MTDLKFTLVDRSGDRDFIAQVDNHTTVGQLADGLQAVVPQPGTDARTLQRVSHRHQILERDMPILSTGVLSGEGLQLAIDTALDQIHQAALSASLRIVDGPDAGSVFDLGAGETTIGRSEACGVRLNDGSASRRHAVVRVADMVEIADAGSTNGILINDRRVDGVQRLATGDRVTIGDTTLEANILGAAEEVGHRDGSRVSFNRPPRIEYPFEPTKVLLPSPPEPPSKPRIPLASAIVPILMGGFLYLITRNIASMAFIAMSPLLIFGNFYEQRKSGAKAKIEQQAEYEATLEDELHKLSLKRDEEIRSKHRVHPSTQELLLTATDRTERLWQREPEHPDFLALRLGLADLPSRIEIDVPQGGKLESRRKLEEIQNSYRTLPEVPLALDARDDAPIGVAGPRPVRLGLGRSLLAQAATLHSPAELHVALVSESVDDWAWLKWLPHSDPPNPRTSEHLIASDPENALRLISSVEEIIDERIESSGPVEEGGLRPVPHLMLIVDGTIGIDQSRFSKLLEVGASAGVTLLWFAETSNLVPNACRSTVIVEPGAQTLTVADSATGLQIGGIPIELVSDEQAEFLARALCPLVDVSTPEGSDADLPATVGLVDLLDGLEVVSSTEPTAARWLESRQGRSLRAPVGVDGAGTLTLDLRLDGPHGLIGGTTGAGKSEFLQSLLAGLAAWHSPERVTFLLVDYKGGSAFGDLVDQYDHDGRRSWKGLRHSVGMITDLTPALVDRALISLRAELHRREVILNDHRAKDLMELEKRGIKDAPPSLIIVVDEFAALAKEVPAFVDGVVDIAQRGRSLGLHLLLATQKPGGVITNNIQANANLRVALRMASEDESNDVVGSPIAGRIDRSTPGRGVMRRGPSDLTAFQSAYVGGVTSPEALARLRIGRLHPNSVDWIHELESTPADTTSEIDLRRLVRVINQTADELGMGSPRRPWLDPLPTMIDLLDLPRPTNDQRIPFGLLDLPDSQSRGVAEFMPDTDGSLLIYGLGGAGKTVLLRTMAASFGLNKANDPVTIHGLDFGGRGLEMLEELPHVGSIISGDDYERVTKLFSEVDREISERGPLLAAARASSLVDYRAATGDPLPRIVVLLDGYDNFMAAYERVDRGKWVEAIPRLIADGRQVGVHFLLTGTRRASFPLALSSNVRSRIVMQLASPDDYLSVNADPKWFNDDMPAGRCRYGGLETQLALVGGDPTTAAEATAFRELGKALTPLVHAAPAIRVLPETALRAEMTDTSSLAWLLTDDFDTIDAPSEGHVVIAGRPRSGKTTALGSFLEAAEAGGDAIPLYTPSGQSQIGKAESFEELTQALAQPDSTIGPAIAIDDAEKIVGTPADFALQEAVGAGLRLIVAVDATTARGFDALFRTLRARCTAVVLQADPTTDGEILGQAIPTSSRPFPPGRAYTNDGGKLTVVQCSVVG